MTEQKITIGPEQAKDWNLFLAVPCYDGSITEPFFISTLEAVQMFSALRMRFSVVTAQDSLISRSRNILAAKFLADEDATHLLFIDADIGYDCRDILKLLMASKDKEIVTGSYPLKKIEWNQIKEASDRGVSPEELAAYGVQFVNNFKQDTGGKVQVVNGLIEIQDAGTGFMLIKREAFLKLIEAYPELKYDDDTNGITEEEKKWTYAFFNSYIDDDKRFLSEDYGFCRYWQKIDGKVWVDPSIHLTHTGKMKYSGRLIDTLTRVGSFGK
jgi:hypothetical protein